MSHAAHVLVRSTVAVVLVVAGLATGWYAAQRLESPAQRAAEASAPAPSPVTAPVSRGDLADEVTATAQVGYAEERQVALPLTGDGRHVVTAQPVAPGSAVAAGDVLLVVSGRPVVVVPGTFPFYRDLRPGDTGPDVAQLQEGLRAAGLTVPEREDGTLRSQTVAAVRRLYTAAGYPAPSEQIETTNPDGTASQASQLLVPAGELLALPELPVLVTALPSVGTVLDGTDATVSLARATLLARADIAPSVIARLTDATGGTLTDDTGGAVDVRVSATTAGDATTGASGSVELTPVSGEIPPEWAGRQVLATLRLEVVASGSLIVPTRAVGVDATGTAHVLRRSEDGSFGAVAVTVLGRLAGQSAVTPLVEGALAEGDQVQVG